MLWWYIKGKILSPKQNGYKNKAKNKYIMFQ